MFAKIALFAIAFAGSVSSSPLPTRRSNHKSIDLWGGHQSLQGFDNFYGSDNYSGYLHEVNVVPEHQIVCKAHQIDIVQQRLLILQEYAKKIVTELICEVETQTFVFEQFHGGLGHFSKHLKRESDYKPGYDVKIAEHFPKLWEDKYEHLGFTGYDYGKNYIVPSGHNWVDDGSSYKSVHEAFIVSEGLKHEPPAWYSPPVHKPTEVYVPPAHETPVYYPPQHETYYPEPPKHTTPAYYPPEHETYYAPPPAEHTPTYYPDTYYAPPPKHTTAEYYEEPVKYAPEPTYYEEKPVVTTSAKAQPTKAVSVKDEKSTPQSDPALAPSTESAAPSASAST